MFEHKEARSGKVCPVRLSGPLLQDLKGYGKLVGEGREVPFLFLTNAKRAGDVTHLRRADVMAAQSVEGGDVEIEVSIIDLI